MPNWCSNVLELEHNSPEMIDRAYRAFKESRLLSEFIPIPDDLKEINDEERQLSQRIGSASWYNFCVNQWGTKWDVGGDDDDAGSPDDGRLTLSFESAWSPPIAAYEKLSYLGFNIRAYYYEPGCAFCGIYTSKDGDRMFDLTDMTSQEVYETIPEDLDDMFSITDSMESWENEQLHEE